MLNNNREGVVKNPMSLRGTLAARSILSAAFLMLFFILFGNRIDSWSNLFIAMLIADRCSALFVFSIEYLTE
jgi:hypothetical protein